MTFRPSRSLQKRQIRRFPRRRRARRNQYGDYCNSCIHSGHHNSYADRAHSLSCEFDLTEHEWARKGHVSVKQDEAILMSVSRARAINVAARLIGASRLVPFLRQV